MGGKKRLRRDLAAAQHAVAVLTRQRLEVLGEQERILDSLARVGFVWIGGERRPADRLRAARAGVIVLDDVHLLADPRLTLERETIPTRCQGDVPGPLRASLALEIGGDPALLDALGNYLRSNR